MENYEDIVERIDKTEEEEMINEILIIEDNPGSWEEAVRAAYKELHDRHFVKESFLQGCMEREKIYPTGLMTEVPVAIPHTDSIHVIVPAICVIRLKDPVLFRNMESPENEVPAQFVFCMALKSGDAQIDILKAILNTAQDKKFLQEAKTESLETVRKKLMRRWEVKDYV